MPAQAFLLFEVPKQHKKLVLVIKKSGKALKRTGGESVLGTEDRARDRRQQRKLLLVQLGRFGGLI